MDAHRWHEISRIFHEALALPPPQRGLYLDNACGADRSLRDQIESLLANESSARAFLRSRDDELIERLPETSASGPDWSAPGGMLGSYRLERRLGSGGMGVVFQAYDTRLCRRVALKVLGARPGIEDSRRFLLHEARNAAALNHPTICTIHEVGEADGKPFIAMEYVEGRTLRERLDGGPLPHGELLNAGIQAADALAYAHDHGVVHRDFKAANVLLTSAGRLKIVDFGLARREAILPGTTTITVVPADAVAGTPQAMAPEQVRGEAADARTDIWALGVLLFEMASGVTPFQGRTIPETFSAILRDPPAPLPPTVPAALAAIIARCLEKEPARRYPRASEVRDALERLRAAAAPSSSPGHPRSRRVWLSAAAALLAAISLLSVALDVDIPRFLAARGSPPPPQAFDSLAVLPLENLSGSAEHDYFAAGMHEALIVGLGKLSGLRRVSARPSVLRYEKLDRPLRQVADDLRVGALITGTVLLSGNRVRITVHLLDPATEQPLWAESYERELRDVLALQNEVVSAIARQVRLQLSPTERTALAAARQVDPEAYRTYLRGMYHLNALTAEGLAKGLALLREALTLDPAEPLAYAGLARGYSLNEIFNPLSSRDDAALATAAAAKAIALDDALAEAHLALAVVRLAKDWDYAGAEESFQRALRINPNLAEAHIAYAQYLGIFGGQDEAIAEWTQGIELDPLSALYRAWLAGAYWEFGRFDDAIGKAHEALELQPDFPVALVVLGLAHLDRGQRAEALAAHERLVSRHPQQGHSAVLARTYALAGRNAEARAILARLHADPPADLAHPWFLAAAYSALGDHDEAVDWLERAFDLRIGFLTNLARERAAGFDLRPLSANARFQALLAKMNLRRTGRSPS